MALGWVAMLCLVAPSADAVGARSGVVATSEDGSAVVFATTDRLVAEDQDSASDIYRRSANGLELVTQEVPEFPCDRQPAADCERWAESVSADTSMIALGGSVWKNGNLTPAQELVPDAVGDAEAIAVSEDGSTVVVSARDDEANVLYAVRDGAAPKLINDGTTDTDPDASLRFDAVSPDGSSIVFTTTSGLLPADTDRGCGRTGGWVDCFDSYIAGPDGLELLTGRPDRTGSEERSPVGVQRWTETGLAFSSPLDLITSDNDAGDDLYSWQNGDVQLLTPGGRAGGDIQSSFVSDELSKVFWETDQAVTDSDRDSAADLYLRDEGGTHLLTGGIGADEEEWDRFRVEDGAQDGSAILVGTSAAMDDSDDNDSPDVYRWTEGTGFSLVSAGPDGAAAGTWLHGADASLSRVLFQSWEPLLAGDTDDYGDLYASGPSGLELLTPNTADPLDGGRGSSRERAALPTFTTQETLDPADQDCGDPDIYSPSVDGYRWLTAENQAGAIVIGGGPCGRIDTASAQFQIESDLADASLECRVDGGSYEACGGDFATGPLGDGPHKVSIRVADQPEIPVETRDFSIETKPPETTITRGPAEGETTLRSSPSFAYAADEPATFECSVDGGAFNDCAYAASNLPDGPHTYAVRATDVAGNVDQTPAERSFLVASPPERDLSYPLQLAWRSEAAAPYTLEAADMDADGVVDLIGEDGGKLVVLRGVGDGSFEDPVALANDVAGFIVGDLDGAQGLDLVVSSLGVGRSGDIGTLLNRGDLDYEPTGFNFESAHRKLAAELAVGDFDGDGTSDLVTTTPTGVQVFHGVGDGELDLTPIETDLDLAADDLGTPSPQALAVAQLDDQPGDDLYVANAETFAGRGPLSAIRSLGDGRFDTTAPAAGATASSTSVIAADLDSDGRDDAIMGASHTQSHEGVRVVLADGYERQLAIGGNYVARPAVADFDGDGILDVASGSLSGPVFGPDINFGEGEGVFSKASAEREWMSGDANAAVDSNVVSADFDGDGKPDLAFSRAGGISVQLNRPPSVDASAVSVPRAVSALRRSGARAQYRCVGECRIRTELTIEKKTAKRLGLGSRVVARSTTSLSGAPKRIRVKLRQSVARKLGRKRVRRLRTTPAARVVFRSGGRSIVRLKTR